MFLASKRGLSWLILIDLVNRISMFRANMSNLIVCACCSNYRPGTQKSRAIQEIPSTSYGEQ